MAGVSTTAPALPAGAVQPAPAASPEQVAAAMGAALGAAPQAGLAPAAPAAGSSPGRLEVPAEFLAKLDAAVAEGLADANAFAKEHTPAERWMVPDWGLIRMAFPPRSDAEDLAYLHQVAKTRTPEGIEVARAWSRHGLSDEWERLLEQYTKRVGPAQARAGRKLLHDALMMTNQATQIAKATNARKRPFAVDPSLPLAVEKPGNNPSFPSGHTSLAFAACIVLSHLMPDRRAEFMAMAKEASWARVYSGVHFPTDVLAGAKLASTVTSYLVRHSMAQPLRGTGAAPNPGVAGGRAALPGAATLAGEPIGAPQPMPAAAGQ